MACGNDCNNSGCTCPVNDKAVIVFDECCLDWGSLVTIPAAQGTPQEDSALVKAWKAGLTFAWCGVSCKITGSTETQCGTCTYIQMSAAELGALLPDEIKALTNYVEPTIAA